MFNLLSGMHAHVDTHVHTNSQESKDRELLGHQQELSLHVQRASILLALPASSKIILES